MSLLLLMLGGFLLVLTIVDALWTVFWVDGNSGPFTQRLTTYIWRGFKTLVPNEKHRLLSFSGPFTLTSTALLWVLLFWGGWVAVFSSDWDSLINAQSRNPATLSERVFYAAYSISTMGNGDVAPVGALWQVASSLTTLSGMFLLTLVISYLISVLSSVTNKRSLASSIRGLGRSPEDIVIHLWDGAGFRGADSLLASISSQLGQVTEQHLAYPILHYYHAARVEKATAVSVVLLDEALLLLERAVSRDVRPYPGVVRATRSAVGTYLETLAGAWISPSEDTPPLPDLGLLRRAGVPVVSDAEFRDAVREEENRRRRLLGMVQNDAWQWPAV